MNRTALVLFCFSLSACLHPPTDNPGGKDTSSGSTSSSEGFSETGGGSWEEIMTSTDGPMAPTSSSGSSEGMGSSTGSDCSPDAECQGEVGCAEDCTWITRQIFVTSKTIPATFTTPQFEQLTPDIFCNRELDCGSDDCGAKALIMDEGGFFPKLSEFQGRYILSSGKVVAEGKVMWTTDELLNPINENKDGGIVSGLAWTGYDPDALWYTCSKDNNPWTGVEGQGRAGVLGEIGSKWFDGEFLDCGIKAHVYCVQ